MLHIIFWLYVSIYSLPKNCTRFSKNICTVAYEQLSCTNLFSLVFKNDHCIYLYTNLCYYLVHKTLCHFLSGYLVSFSSISFSLQYFSEFFLWGLGKQILG
ncbi:hypothetical protein VIGAN_03136800 [Vigna angularis var. angularis]|uniref:Uncharacterized protein n=1 Tax=Vigna angularis var. angularis TaxID=157739 RepID=A0A0S3RLZ1_PHAAN|nr:hypothetical protein VIGAN_03136800 [Vigna angularis var. angularis]